MRRERRARDFCGELVSEAQICAGAPSEVGPEVQERREAPSEVDWALEAERVQAKLVGRPEW